MSGAVCTIRSWLASAESNFRIFSVLTKQNVRSTIPIKEHSCNKSYCARTYLPLRRHTSDKSGDRIVTVQVLEGCTHFATDVQPRVIANLIHNHP